MVAYAPTMQSAALVSTESTFCRPTVSIPMQFECVREVDKMSILLGIAAVVYAAEEVINGKMLVFFSLNTGKRCLSYHKHTAHRPKLTKRAHKASRNIFCASPIHSAAPGGHMLAQVNGPQADTRYAGLIRRLR